MLNPSLMGTTVGGQVGPGMIEHKPVPPRLCLMASESPSIHTHRLVSAHYRAFFSKMNPLGDSTLSPVLLLFDC